MLVLEEKNRIVHTLWHAANIPDSSRESLKCQLRSITKHVKDLVLLAKSRWYSKICGHIHNMRMNPWLAWENSGECAHHKKLSTWQ